MNLEEAIESKESKGFFNKFCRFIGRNKWARRTFYTLSALFALEAVDMVFDRKEALAQTSGKIVFNATSPSSENLDVYIIDPDGKNVKNLTNTSTESEIHARISPDGKSILFELNDNIYIIGSDGSNKSKIIDNGLWPSWYPDGTKLIYTDKTSNNAYTASPSGSNKSKIIEDSITQAIFLDSQKLLYVSSSILAEYIYLFDINTKTKTSLTAGRRPSYSNGKIAFDRGGNVYIGNLSGDSLTNITNLTSDTGFYSEWSPSFSPDGKEIVYVFSLDIGKMNIDGSNKVTIPIGDFIYPKDVHWGGGGSVAPPPSDTQAPTFSNYFPSKNATNVLKNTNISLDVTDASGVVQSSLEMTVEGSKINPAVTSITNGFHLLYDPPQDFSYSQQVDVTVKAKDNSSNQNQGQDSWYFTIMELNPADLNLFKVEAYTLAPGTNPIAGEDSKIRLSIKNEGDETWQNKEFIAEVYVVDRYHYGKYDGFWTQLRAHSTVRQYKQIKITDLGNIAAKQTITKDLDFVFRAPDFSEELYVDLIPKNKNESLDSNKSNNNTYTFFEVGFNNEAYINFFGEVLTVLTYGHAKSEAVNKAVEMIRTAYEKGVEAYDLAEQAEEVIELLKQEKYEDAGYTAVEVAEKVETLLSEEEGEEMLETLIPFFDAAWNEFNGVGGGAAVGHASLKFWEFVDGIAKKLGEDNISTVEVKSPADIYIKSEGKETSIKSDGTAKKELPLSTGYLINTEDDNIKVVHFKQETGKTYNVELQGTDTGTLDLIVTQNRNGNVVTNEYNDVSVQNNSKGTLEVSAQSDDELGVDLNNDGSIDKVIEPVQTIEPIEPIERPSKIAFVSERDGNKEIYTMNPDGTNQINLTKNPAYDGFPDWSPDGKKIAFNSDRDGNWEIYVMNADGTNQINLTNNSSKDQFPSWSPNGTKIAFVSERDSNLEVYTMNPDGKNQINLTKNPARDDNPAWSPNGTKIAFVSERDGNNEIYIMSEDGTNQVNLTNNLAHEISHSWSPDGNKIVFYSTRNGYTEIYVINSDGTNQIRLTNNSENDAGPSWSPDGKKIAYVTLTWEKNVNYWEIYVINADGTGINQINLTENSYFFFNSPFISWSPDGKKIAFSSERDGNLEIYVMNEYGTNQIRLTDSQREDYNPVWSPFLDTLDIPVPTSIEELITGAKLPQAYDISQNYPNPFNPSTTIKYELPELSNVRINIYNLRGQKVKTLVDRMQAEGTYSVEWDGIDENGKKVSSGVYLYRLETPEFIKTRKMVLIK